MSGQRHPSATCALTWSLLFALCLGSPGCATETTVLVDLASGDGAVSDHAGAASQVNDASADAPGRFETGSESDAAPVDAATGTEGRCSRPDSCGPLGCFPGTCGLLGTCRDGGAACDDQLEPVCGCDGITYWNDCIRAQRGVPSSTQLPCRNDSLACRDASDCGVAGASCARLIGPGAPCPPDIAGACWVLPPICPASSLLEPRLSLATIACVPQPGTCDDLCTAVRSGLPHLWSFTGPCR